MASAPEPDRPIGYDDYIRETAGLSAFFTPLTTEEMSEANLLIDTGFVPDDIDTPLTWSANLGIPEAPRDPSARIALITLAVELDLRDVVRRAAAEDPHPGVRKYAANNS